MFLRVVLQPLVGRAIFVRGGRVGGCLAFKRRICFCFLPQAEIEEPGRDTYIFCCGEGRFYVEALIGLSTRTGPLVVTNAVSTRHVLCTSTNALFAIVAATSRVGLGDIKVVVRRRSCVLSKVRILQDDDPTRCVSLFGSADLG